MIDKLIIRGAREHNLKNISLELPRNKFVVFTGISGSGKSTLAFDTIFAEGQRRYLESLSAYARQFLGQMDKPDVDYIEGLSPAISIDQKSASHNPRSTVGTVTEIHDYLRLLYARIGTPHCPMCRREISKLSTDEIVDRILELPGGTTIEIISPVVRQRKGEYTALLIEMFKRGFSRAYINGKKYDMHPSSKEVPKLARYKKHDIEVVVDETAVGEENVSRIFDDVERALKLSEGIIKINFQFPKKKSRGTKENTEIKSVIYNQNLACPVHEVEFPELEPRLFSFNSPTGACPDCEGLGVKKEIDADLIIPDKNRTIAEGGILPWSYKRNNYQSAVLRAAVRYYHIPDNIRIRDLKEDKLELLLHGRSANEEADEILVSLRSARGSTWKFHVQWKGVVSLLKDRYLKTESESVRQDMEKYMSESPCSRCGGSRYKPEVLLVTVHGKNIHEISGVSIASALDFFDGLPLTQKEKLIAGRIRSEIQKRLRFLNNVGLGYLTLGRSAQTLAGGETQRIRLASQIGSQLVGVLYILDEPSVGLHARDNTKLLDTLLRLRDLGNTLIVVEHDEETIRAADYIVDMGHGAGRLGGEVVAQGTVDEVLECKDSLTAKYLRKETRIEIPSSRRPVANKKSIVIRGASEHNLRNITVEFPLKVFVCVTGVSGSGKSTLVEDILYKALSSKLMRSLEKPGKFQEMPGTHHVNKVIMIDQSPIGRTPRSNPATYTGLFTPIRVLFAGSKDAKARGYSPGRFSFNVKGGRCENCDGEGFLKIEMQFMPDVYLPCDVCKGTRYNSETLQAKYKGKNIAEVLAMTVSESKEFFESFSEIYDKLKILEDVGLGYINLGQSATTLSGGEAQRIKLAAELARRATGNTLYILDEPTTGLHFDDIKKLLHVLNRLVDAGNSVVVIEHNMDVIKTADWIIDLGPEGGEGGGRVVVTGTPEEVARHGEESYTGKYLKETINYGYKK